jgi:hypothetical protein
MSEINTSGTTNFIRDFFRRVNASQETGFEKAISYILFCLSLATPGIHLKNWLGRHSDRHKATIVDIYVTAKLSFTILSAIFGWYLSKDGSINFIYCLIVWFTAETIVYNLLQILCYNFLHPLNALKRNIILGFFNYLEIVFSFSIFYAALHLVRQSCQTDKDPAYTWIDYLYFSVGSGGVLGYGDYAVYSDTGKLLTILQCILFIMLFTLFVTYNITLFTDARTQKTG